MPNDQGLMTLLRNAEEDYSTLLHLERVLNMRECGDHRELFGLEKFDEFQDGNLRSMAVSSRKVMATAIDLSGGGSRSRDVLEDLFNGSEEVGGPRGGGAAGSRNLRQPLLPKSTDDQLEEEGSEDGDFDEEDSGGLSMTIGQSNGQIRAIKPCRSTVARFTFRGANDGYYYGKKVLEPLEVQTLRT